MGKNYGLKTDKDDIDYLERKLREKDKEIAKLKDLVNTKVSGREFWDTVEYCKGESDTLKGSANYANVDSDVEITGDGVKTSSTNTETQPYPVQRALKRIQELKYITDVRIDEEFETTVDDFPKNRLTITIDYLDIDFLKEARKD